MNSKPDLVVVFSPNHTGDGTLSLMNKGFWRTPLGDVEIDTSSANEILRECDILDLDDSAHSREHSIEVQLPFLQYIYESTFKFVPICFRMQDLESSREVGHAVAKVLLGKKGLVIASNDMTHYEPRKETVRKDKMAIDTILKLDERQFYSTIKTHSISSCGYGPVVAAITVVKALQAKKAQLLCYKTSGDITGDIHSVVGYASISFSRDPV